MRSASPRCGNATTTRFPARIRPAKSGSASLTVSVAALHHFFLTPSTTTPTAGTSFTTTVAARDLYDNTVTTYSGTKTVAWSGLSTSPAPASQAPAYPVTSRIRWLPESSISTPPAGPTAKPAGESSQADVARQPSPRNPPVPLPAIV